MRCSTSSRILVEVDDFVVYLVDDTHKPILKVYTSHDANYWKEAIHSEMDSILTNKTWEVTE